MEKQTILIVEDNDEVVDVIKSTLEKIESGYIIRTASNGKEGLDIIEQEKVDLALLDVNMPVMTGAQLLTELCNRKIWLPIIILSAFNLKDLDRNFSEFGIIDLVCKPLDMLVLKQKIIEVLKKRVKRDSISGMSLAAIMQVLEMEKRTGIMTVKSDNRNGRIFFKKGKVVDIEADGVSAEEALGDFLDQSNENKEISIEYLAHKRKETINRSLTEILIETSRLLDEKKENIIRNRDQTNDPGENKPREKSVVINQYRYHHLVERLKQELGDALLSTGIWALHGGVTISGYNWEDNLSELFSHFIFNAHETLSKAKFPEPGHFFIMSLKDGKTSVTVHVGEYAWGMLIDSEKIPPDVLLKELLPKYTAGFEEAVRS
jgi:CheY-like chemotaxis protein